MPDVLERLKSALADHYAVEYEIGRGGSHRISRLVDSTQ
jgi:hypothetical protein